mmetsp:Transcript_25221/g.72622  ORF Transcript_25221/g.72622 Transcript_25221/m.72622 type:complete len:228 (-) Transcript_25221:179-862(-)
MMSPRLPFVKMSAMAFMMLRAEANSFAKTLMAITSASGATPNFLPAAVPATCVPWPSVSRHRSSLLELQSPNFSLLSTKATCVTRPSSSLCVGLTPVSTTQIRVPRPVARVRSSPIRFWFQESVRKPRASSSSSADSELFGAGSPMTPSSSTSATSGWASATAVTSSSAHVASTTSIPANASHTHLLPSHTAAGAGPPDTFSAKSHVCLAASLRTVVSLSLLPSPAA